MVRYTKSPSQPESSVAVEEEKRRRSPAATRVPPEALSPPVEATMQKDEKEGDETVKPRTQYIVVESKPIPYVRQHHHNDTSAQPLRVSSNPRAPQKSKLDIVDHLWSMRFQRLRSLPRLPVRPGVTLPCLPKNLVRPATRAQLLRDARAAAAIPLSTTYEQIADKINELNASTNPPKEADRNPAVILAEKKCF
ncbi:hypothetical protein D0Z00_001470 [Geotrichum galactomycetum]|uniref:Uncharacterized protein n=1 Tax=Geotrichum galactomycetum TaxID=27317 RepID=A0ACB6V750_9ASCO|nr:hypothetical protein D0Z00_001470 [Geotrichum candidum]